MTLFASATRNADTWANRVRVFAGSIASFALTVFFTVATHLWLDGHGFDGWHAASFRTDADAVFIFQKSGFAEATDDTLEGTHGGWLRIGAIWYASGSTCQKFGIGTAFFFDWKSRGGDSEPEGTSAEQQDVS